MVRWLAGVFLVVAGLAHGADAQTTVYYHVQGDGITPLRSWCLSALQTSCIHFHSWRFEYTNHFPYTTVGTFEAEVEITGPGDGDRAVAFEMFAPSFSAMGWQPDFVAYYSHPGYIGEEDYAASPILAPTTLEAPMELTWADGYCVTRDGVDRWANHQRCVRVPEPSSVLLLLSGVLGLGYVRARSDVTV